MTIYLVLVGNCFIILSRALNLLREELFQRFSGRTKAMVVEDIILYYRSTINHFTACAKVSLMTTLSCIRGIVS